MIEKIESPEHRDAHVSALTDKVNELVEALNKVRTPERKKATPARKSR